MLPRQAPQTGIKSRVILSLFPHLAFINAKIVRDDLIATGGFAAF